MESVCSNPHELAARLTKAHRLAAALHRAGISSEKAELILPWEWARLALKVGVNRPSDETVKLTVHQLREFEGILQPEDWRKLSA